MGVNYADDEDPIKIGSRVRCHKQGSFDGAIGKVRDILNTHELLKVEFENTTLIDKRTYFEKV